MGNHESEISRRKVLAGAGVAGAALGVAAMSDLTAQAATSDGAISPQLQIMLDKQAVAEVMMTYCRAVDHLDEDLLRSVFHPGSQHSHGFKGPSSMTDGSPDFVAYAFGVLRGHHRTHHQLGNIFVEIEGDVAYTEAYFTALHRRRAIGDPEAADGATETEMDYFVAGRYLDRMEKRDGVWKITNRTGLTDWTRTEDPTDPGLDEAPADVAGQHGPEDFVFHRREHYEPK
jgi:hypothetical protein